MAGSGCELQKIKVFVSAAAPHRLAQQQLLVYPAPLFNSILKKDEPYHSNILKNIRMIYGMPQKLFIFTKVLFGIAHEV